MFFAAFTLRSCTVPHSLQVHTLIPRPAIPLGPLRESHTEQVWVENASLILANVAPAKSHLYGSIVRKAVRRVSIVFRIWEKQVTSVWIARVRLISSP